jgi:hypothetical protein
MADCRSSLCHFMRLLDRIFLHTKEIMPAPNFTKGWVYNLEEISDSTEADRVIALAATLSSIACPLVVLRLMVRLKTTRIIGVGVGRYLDWESS